MFKYSGVRLRVVLSPARNNGRRTFVCADQRPRRFRTVFALKSYDRPIVFARAYRSEPARGQRTENVRGTRKTRANPSRRNRRQTRDCIAPVRRGLLFTVRRRAPVGGGVAVAPTTGLRRETVVRRNISVDERGRGRGGVDRNPSRRKTCTLSFGVFGLVSM